MAKNILIIHGWESNSREHWYGQAHDYFEALGYHVEIPDMPGGYFPKLQEWIEIIASYHPDKSWVLIGHSLGGVAILKYLEKQMQIVDKVILIAVPCDSMNMGAIQNFFNPTFDFDKIISSKNKFFMIYEQNDVVVPLEHGQHLSDALHCPLQIIPGYSHVRTLDLKILKEVIKKA